MRRSSSHPNNIAGLIMLINSGIYYWQQMPKDQQSTMDVLLLWDLENALKQIRSEHERSGSTST